MSKKPFKNPIEVNELSKEQKVSMKSRIVVAAILLSIGVPSIFLGSWFFFILVMAVISISIFEVLTAPRKDFPRPVYVATFVLIFYFVYWIFIKNNVHEFMYNHDHWIENFNNSFLGDGLCYLGFNQIYVPPMGIIAALVILFFICFLVTRFNVYDVCYFFSMAVLLGLGFQAVYFLRYCPFTYFNAIEGFDITNNSFRFAQSAFLLIYLLLGVFMNDIGAYFTGVLFGRNKVNPRISPKKTWEGVVGGGLISLIFSAGFAFIVSICDMPILPNFDLSHWYWIILLSVMMVALSNLGDFSFSAIKRFFGIKDYSHIFKTHGGALDRFDSTLFSAIAIAVLVVLIEQQWHLFR